MVALAAIVVVVIIAAAIVLIWVPNGSHGTPSTPVKHGITTTIPTIQTSNQSGSTLSSTSALVAALSVYPQQSQFTANYNGSIYTSLSTSPSPLSGTLLSQYERYGNSAKSVTSIFYNRSSQVKTAVYYSANGPAYACVLNMTTQNYGCQIITTEFNASNFGLSILLAMLSNSSANSLKIYNSSYNGLSCIEVSANTSSSYNSSGVILSSEQHLSSCIQPKYRVPLTLNLSSLNTASGSYYNGTTKTAVPTVSETLMVELHLVNLTNSSSESDVQNLPANAVMVG